MFLHLHSLENSLIKHILPTDSIVFTEYPRCGGTFISALVLHSVFGACSVEQELITQSSFFDIVYDLDQVSSLKRILCSNIPKSKFYKTHKTMTGPYRFLIFYRKSIDAFRSYYAYLGLHKLSGKPEEKIKKFLESSNGIKSFIHFYSHYVNNQKNQISFLIKYEDMVFNPNKVLIALRKSFGLKPVDDLVLNSTINRYSLDSWINIETSWNNNFSVKYKRKNLRTHSDWNDLMAQDAIESSCYYRQLVEIEELISSGV